MYQGKGKGKELPVSFLEGEGENVGGWDKINVYRTFIPTYCEVKCPFLTH